MIIVLVRDIDVKISVEEILDSYKPDIFIKYPESYLHPLDVIHRAEYLIKYEIYNSLIERVVITNSTDFVMAMKCMANFYKCNVEFHLVNSDGIINCGTDIEPLFASFNKVFKELEKFETEES